MGMTHELTGIETSGDDAVHPWERAGLGKAPFRWMGISEERGPKRYLNRDGTETIIGSEGQPMGSCAYCAQGIAEVHHIRSADGRNFTVGCDCVRRCNPADAPVLTKAERASKKARNAKARARSASNAEASSARLTELLADEGVRGKLAARPSAQAWKAAEGGTELDDVEWLATRCGHTGRAKLIARLEAL